MSMLFRGMSSKKGKSAESTVKKSLITQLSAAVKDLQIEQTDEYMDNAVSNDAANTLCTVLEAVFLHGLKDSFLRRVSMAVHTDIDDRPEPNFWAPLLIVSHRNVIDQISKLSLVTTDIGRSRAWIRLALNDGLTSRYFETIRREGQRALSQYYRPGALLRDTDVLDVAQRLIEGVETTPLDLPLNSSLFDTWTQQPLLLAGLWTPPLRATALQQSVTTGVEVAEILDREDQDSLSDTRSVMSIRSFPGTGIEQMVSLKEEDALKIILGTPVYETPIAARERADQSIKGNGEKDGNLMKPELKEEITCAVSVQGHIQLQDNEAVEKTNEENDDSGKGNSLSGRFGWSSSFDEKSSESNVQAKIEENPDGKIPPPRQAGRKLRSFHSLLESYHGTASTSNARPPVLDDLLQQFQVPAPSAPLDPESRKQVQDEVHQVANLETRTVNLDDLEDVLLRRFPVTALFSAMDTREKLDAALVQNFGMIEPAQIIFGRRWVLRRRPTVDVVEKTFKGYHIPFLESLCRLLKNDQVRDCVDNPIVSNNVMKTVLDGSYYRHNEFFSTNPCSLAVILYYDELELVNPLGSRTHKLGMFYWSLANIHPEFRSTFNAVNLLGIAKYCDIKEFGIEIFLRQFAQDIHTLQIEDITVHANGVQKNYKGSLLFCTADTPAAAVLGGFKQSVSAQKPCRRCMAGQDTLRRQFLQRDFVLRTLDVHLQQVEFISNPEHSVQVRNFWRQSYGINGRSPLLDIPFFDITKCFPQDIMHVISEGCLEVAVRVFLKWCHENGSFTMEQLNEKIDLFHYGHFSKNKPSKISVQHLQNGLRQSAAQMMCLAHVLPFLVDFILPEPPLNGTDLHERLLCLILLLQITNVCFAFTVTQDDAHFLERSIEVFLLNFSRLYPNALVPKFHFLIHIPSQIIEFRPARQQWCMRFEAVHSWYKTVARVIRSFKNISYSLAYRNETYRCMQLNPMPGLPAPQFLYQGHSIKEGPIITMRDIEEIDHLLPVLPINVDVNVSQLMRSTEVVVHGTTYVEGSVTLLTCVDNNLPEFGKIVKIYVFESDLFFIVHPFETTRYYDTLNAYHVVESQMAPVHAVALSNVVHPYPLSVFYARGRKYIALLNHTRTEFVDL